MAVRVTTEAWVVGGRQKPAVKVTTFAEWLEERMASVGIRSIRQLGRMTGIDPMRIGDWLMGASLPEREDDYQRLARYFGVSVETVRQALQTAPVAPPPRRRWAFSGDGFRR